MRNKALKYGGIGLLVTAIGVVASPVAAFAQDEGPTTAALQGTLDNVYILLSAVLVIFMQAGFALESKRVSRERRTSPTS